MDSMAYTVQWSGLVHLGQLPFLLQLISLVFFWNLQTFFVRGVLCLLAIICSFQVHSMTTNAILIVESVFYRVMTGRRRDHFNRMLLFLHTRFSPSLVMFSLELILFTGSEPLRWLYSCIARCVLSATLDYCERRSSAEWAHLTTLGKLFLLALLLGQFFLNLLLWSFYATLSPLEVKQSGDSVRAWYILITDAMAFTLTNAEFILIGIGKLFFGDGVGQPLGGEHIFDVDTQTFQIAVSILTGTLSSIGAWVYAPNLSSVFYQFAILRRIVSTGYRVQALRHYTQMLDNIEDGKGETGEQCSICLEEFGEKELVKRLTCGHYFHRQCLRMWLARSWSCPICRRNSARRPLWENPYDPYMRLTITDTRELHD
ncbi:putative zinc finger protein [Angomonas deanei]|uniref:RING-like zinc finger/Zinc finger, C3HC4 type (RING finger)/Ring finger domain/zinc-RING finger domain/RING-type zinc-finger containing protein, putative n=1 Tax=Angomonas deanei TaxID=59799 RepID=A0A7G2C4B0_9TRYP|nr:putative zinc finger protein [Angomonas deanei]CAD2214449.1 RING-like zinc finger/Zinc finger, C3HC4 type (RING finger)/Ring finger domain/zinc-RING finger domain/RING-type zinc-finger containing protein, putative [Angomonas deanei]|eukprot:EPY22476.1 putative zinc finger protein [Angomonas deanei]